MKTILYHVTKANLVDSIFKNGLVPFIGPRSYVSGEQEAHIYLCDKESVPMWKALLNADTVLRVVIDDSILRNDKICHFCQYTGYSEYFLIKPIAPKKICISREEFVLSEEEKHLVMISKINEITELCNAYLHVIVLPNSKSTESKLRFLSNVSLTAEMIKETIEKFDYNELPMDYILDYISSGEQTLFTMVQVTPKIQLMLYDLLKTYPTKDPNVLWMYHWVDKVLAQRIQDYAEQNGFA